MQTIRLLSSLRWAYMLTLVVNGATHSQRMLLPGPRPEPLIPLLAEVKLGLAYTIRSDSLLERSHTPEGR